MSTLKVNTIRHTGASSDAVTLATDGTCTAKITNRSNRNLIINGAMNVAQRGTSSTSTGYQTVDRITMYHGGTDEAPTYSQADVASGTTPYSLGFRKCMKITNGNQTSGLGAGDEIQFDYVIEAQDVANSGWNYTSASSYITLSYWVKSSVAQTFYGYFLTRDGTQQLYSFSTGALSANTWTKITKTIPGNSNIQVDNNNGAGFNINLFSLMGTDRTGTITENAWGTWNANLRTPNQATTWYTTNDATFEVTGVQLEVGDVATDFEHRSYGDELARCQRYYQKFTGISYRMFTKNVHRWAAPLPVKLRAVPTATKSYTSTTHMGNDHTTSADGTMLNYSLSTDPSGSDNIIDNGGGIITLDSEL